MTEKSDEKPMYVIAGRNKKAFATFHEVSAIQAEIATLSDSQRCTALTLRPDGGDE